MDDHKSFLAEVGDVETISRLMLEHLPLGVALVNGANGQVLAVNARLRSMLGRSREELLGDRWMRDADAGVLAWYRAQGNRLLAGDIAQFSHEMQFTRPDGSPGWASVLVSRVANADDQAGYLMAVVDDISERKAKALELDQANERVALAERSAKAGLWDWDLRTGKLTWSAAMYRLSGFAEKEVEPTYELWLNTVHPDDRKAAEEGWVSALDERNALSNQYRIVLPDGEIRWIESYGDAERDTSGEVMRMIGFSIDVTERRLMAREKADLERLARELRQSEERLELALGASGLGLWDYSMADDRGFYDKRWCEILGYQPGEIEAHPNGWRQRVHPDDLAAVEKSLAEHLNGETPIHEAEHRLRHKDGHWVWVMGQGKVVERDAEGKPRRLVGTLLDINSRKRLAQEGASLLQHFESLLRGTAAIPALSGVAADTEKAGAVPGNLTRRQRQILALIAQGLTSPQIAEKLHIAPATAVTHRRELMRKLDLHSAAEVTRFALRYRILPD